MTETKTLAIFGNGLTAEFGYYNKAKNAVTKAEEQFSKRKTALIQGLYEKLQSLITDQQVNDFFDCYSQNGKPLLLDLVTLHFKDKDKIAKTSEICCSKYAFSHLGKEAVDAIVKTIKEKSIFGLYADIDVVLNQTGLCFKLVLKNL